MFPRKRCTVIRMAEENHTTPGTTSGRKLLMVSWEIPYLTLKKELDGSRQGISDDQWRRLTDWLDKCSGVSPMLKSTPGCLHWQMQTTVRLIKSRYHAWHNDHPHPHPFFCSVTTWTWNGLNWDYRSQIYTRSNNWLPKKIGQSCDCVRIHTGVGYNGMNMTLPRRCLEEVSDWVKRGLVREASKKPD